MNVLFWIAMSSAVSVGSFMVGWHSRGMKTPDGTRITGWVHGDNLSNCRFTDGTHTVRSDQPVRGATLVIHEDANSPTPEQTA